MDIATLLETHRKHMLDAIGDDELESVAERAHDRATTKTLLDMHRTASAPQVPITVAVPPKSRLIKSGSKAAKARAEKAQRTRLENLARKAQDAKANGGAASEPPMSSATHMERTEGGQ